MNGRDKNTTGQLYWTENNIGQLHRTKNLHWDHLSHLT